MTEALIGGVQYGCVIRNNFHRIAKGIEDLSVRQFHIAKERVLRTAGWTGLGCAGVCLLNDLVHHCFCALHFCLSARTFHRHHFPMATFPRFDKYASDK